MTILAEVAVDKVPVSERALAQRIDRALAPDGLTLRKSRPGSRQQQNVGDYYVIDVNANAVVWSYVNLEAYAEELGVLAAYECLNGEA